MSAAMVTQCCVKTLRNGILSSDKCQGTLLKNRAKIYLGEKQLLNVLSSYPGSSRIAFKYHIDRLVWVQLHSDRVDLKHGALGSPRLVEVLGLGLALRKSLLSQALLAQLFLGIEIFVHPEQLLDPTSLVGQLEAVIIGVQAGKEEAGIERAQLWGVLFSSTPLGSSPIKCIYKMNNEIDFIFKNLGRLRHDAMRSYHSKRTRYYLLMESSTWVWFLNFHQLGRGIWTQTWYMWKSH